MELINILNIDTSTNRDVIAAQLAENATTGKQQRDFLSTVIREFETSEKYRFMSVADKYYRNKNDVLDDKRMVIGRDSEGNAILQESRVLSNTRLSHNFFKKLTRQKIAYMLGKPFDLSSDKEDDELAIEFFDKAKQYMTKPFFRMLKNVGRDSIIKGIGWLHVYYNEEGELKFKRCAPEEVIPFWKDSDHTELDAVIRRYGVEDYSSGAKEIIKHIDYYTEEGIFHYIIDRDGEMHVNTEKNNGFSGHFKAIVNGEETNATWLEIPFIAFKFDADEQSLLERIKELIDDYDRKTSLVANIIQDFPNAITVVKNYDGESKEEFVANKNEYRTIFVQNDGGAEVLETPLNVTELDVHIQRLREDIYEFGQGVNTADKDIRDTSGVALRFMYADLDMDCIDWGGEFEASVHKLLWFVQQDLLLRGGNDYSSVEYSVLFNTDVIVNESETITNAFTSVGVISDETIAENHPWVKSAQKELKKMLGDKEEDFELEQEYATPNQSTSSSNVLFKNAKQGGMTSGNTEAK